jgi:hypothetical protein
MATGQSSHRVLIGLFQFERLCELGIQAISGVRANRNPYPLVHWNTDRITIRGNVEWAILLSSSKGIVRRILWVRSMQISEGVRCLIDGQWNPLPPTQAQ